MSTFTQMKEFLRASWAARDFIVPCLIGPPGIGKTAAVREHAAEHDARCTVIIASQILPNEVSGITMPDAESKAMEIYDHYRLSQLEDGDVLFFDELLEADQMVLSACLTLIESRQMMSGKMLPDIQIIAATNPSVSPQMLRDNIRQRFCFREFHMDPSGTREYIREKWGFDIGSTLQGCMEAESNNYNILTPRSMTKMAGWIARAGKDLDLVAEEIDEMWSIRLGSMLKDQYLSVKKFNDIRAQLRDALELSSVDKDKLPVDVSESLYNETGEFKTITLEELMEYISSLPEWKAMAELLASIEVKEE